MENIGPTLYHRPEPKSFKTSKSNASKEANISDLRSSLSPGLIPVKRSSQVLNQITFYINVLNLYYATDRLGTLLRSPGRTKLLCAAQRTTDSDPGKIPSPRHRVLDGRAPSRHRKRSATKNSEPPGMQNFRWELLRHCRTPGTCATGRQQRAQIRRETRDCNIRGGFPIPAQARGANAPAPKKPAVHSSQQKSSLSTPPAAGSSINNTGLLKYFSSA